MVFRNIVLCALLVAAVAGSLFSFYQHALVTPIIFKAEKYEVADYAEGNPVVATQHEPTWSPDTGFERTVFTIGANFLAAFGFSILLVSGMALVGNSSPVRGMLWGCAGYWAFFAGPALGLSPEIPGMRAGGLEGRQAWWILTAVMSAAGLALLFFGDRFLKLSSIVLLGFPHLIGAPVTESHAFPHTDAKTLEILEALWRQFVLQTCIANALLWIIMGLLSGVLAKHFIDRLDEAKN